MISNREAQISGAGMSNTLVAGSHIVDSPATHHIHLDVVALQELFDPLPITASSKVS